MPPMNQGEYTAGRTRKRTYQGHVRKAKEWSYYVIQ